MKEGKEGWTKKSTDKKRMDEGKNGWMGGKREEERDR